MRTPRSLRWSLLSASSLLLVACSEDAARPSADAAVSAVAADAPAVDVPSDLAPVDAPDAAAAKDAPDASGPRCNPLAITDDCLLPWPSDLLTRADPSTPTGRRLALPENVLQVPSGRVNIDVVPFNRADGAPSTAPILVHFGDLVAPEFLADYTQTARSLEAASAIALFDLTHMRRVPFLAEMDANRRDGATDRAALIIRPLEPLPFGARVVVAIRRAIRTPGGAPLRASPGFVALRDRTPSADPRIEAARPEYESLFTFLASQGYARDDLHLAFAYTVVSERHALGPIMAMRSEVIRRAGLAGQIPFTIERVQDAPNPNVARIVTGTFTPPGWLDARNTITFADDATPTLQPMAPSYPFTMVIPARALREHTPLPLVIFGHGVFGTGRDYLTGDAARVIHPLAEQVGAVIVATDWIGLSGGDRDLIIRDVVTNINRINLVTDRLLQSLANNLALEEISVGALSADPRVRFEGSALIDPTRVYYYGVSLGGIQGSSFVSVSRRVSRAVLAVPGASWSNLLPRSIVYAPIRSFVDAIYPDPLVQAEFISLLQYRFDYSDPANVTRLFRAPPDPSASRTVLVQEAVGDCLVPNVTTDILARGFGLPVITPADAPAFGLRTATSPSSESALVQYAITPSLARYSPPRDNTVPSMDNNVHSDLVYLPNTGQQVVTFLGTGRIEQTCTGSCDPD
jgi:hypothetical protein